MRIAVTGATGLIGTRLVAALRERGDEVTVLSRRPDDARRMLGVEAVGWRVEEEPAPVEALAGRDAVVHLAGESIAQRWTRQSKERIRSSRELGTARLVEGLRQAEPRPRVLASAPAVGYYGPRGPEPLEEAASPGTGFLASVCEAWEGARMLPVFRLGVGGPVAGGDQYISWIALDDLVRMYLAALDDPEWSGPINATAPEPVTNKQFARALGRVLHRPALLPAPSVALRGSTARWRASSPQASA